MFPSPIGVFFLFLQKITLSTQEGLCFHPLLGFSSYFCDRNAANDV
ncbi:hypothetical protein GCWU000282_01842 [Catonella morbi ATCC 51271]|uniref:Uncharacterized protein n=1 Tax=Catonella morbi ATCC 51271 TaxID=592026 RepID=V2Y5K1_9FIRM|nr:hypothetical protein GCWU000282_01842 [Catonella morbi ATCC 51271]